MTDQSSRTGTQLAERSPQQRFFLLGLALVTAATLGLEVLQTRLLSVVTWYSLAFLVIAMGLFGLTAGALHVYLRPSDFNFDALGQELSKRARQFALSIPVSLIVILCLPLTTAPVATTLLLFVLFGVALALPYYPAGIVVATALTRTSLPVGRVYAVDLLGAALGAPLMPWLLHYVDGETAVLVVAVFAALAAYAFAAAGSDAPGKRSSLGVAAFTLLLAVVNGASQYGLQPLWVKGRADYHEYVAELWNSHSRIRISHKITGPALLWGGGSRCTPPVVGYRVIEIDAGAGTAMFDAPADMSGLDYLTCDVTDIANLIRPGGRAGIIGVGGARDLQGALAAGHNPVFGIDINARILELVRGEYGQATSVPTHPNVQLVHEDGRSYFSRASSDFRLIQASLIDTWAATGAGAHALGENGLYTLEAWRTFLNRLEPGGVLTMSRWTQETLRVASLAMAALLDRNVKDPAAHFALVSTPLIVTSIVGRDPLTPEDVAKLHQISAEKGFTVLVAPGVVQPDGPLKQVLSAKTQAELERATLSKTADNRPPTDDRPYFFNVLPIEAAWRKLEPIVNMGSIEGNQVATRTLALSFLSSLLLVLMTIVVPLVRVRTRERRAPGLYAGIVYFLLIGVGFMMAEVVLLQRLSLILGDPSYSLIVVVSSLVASMGLGSLVSDRLPLHRAPLCYAYPLFIALALAVCAVLWPQLSAYAIAAPTTTRIVIAVAITTGLGLPLGMAFPAGMRLAQREHSNETPWFWGMNGVGSVLASSLAVIVSQRWGLTVAMLSAAAAYALLPIPIALWLAQSKAAR
jgi:hypothetical protein